MEIKWLDVSFVFLSLFWTCQSHGMKIEEESETQIKRNRRSTTPEKDSLLNVNLSPQQLKIELGKQKDQNDNVTKKRRLGVMSNKQPGLLTEATKVAVIPINTLNDILGANRNIRKGKKSGKNKPKKLKAKENQIPSFVMPKIELPLNKALTDSKNTTDDSTTNKKNKSKDKKPKYKQILIVDNDDIERDKNEDDMKYKASSGSIALNNTLGNLKQNKLFKAVAKSNQNDENNKSKNGSKPISANIDYTTPNNKTKIENQTESLINQKKNLTFESIPEDNDFETNHNKKSLISNEKLDESIDKKGNILDHNRNNVIDNIHEKPKTISIYVDKESEMNDLISINIADREIDKMLSESDNSLEIGIISKSNLKERLRDDSNLQGNEQNSKSFINDINRSITVDKTNFEEIHESYPENPHGIQLPEQENDLSSPDQSEINYGQDSQYPYPYQYGSYQTIPYYDNESNNQYSNYIFPSSQYNQPFYYGNGVNGPNFGENEDVGNAWKSPLYNYAQSQYRQPNTNINYRNLMEENEGIVKPWKDCAYNVGSRYRQPNKVKEARKNSFGGSDLVYSKTESPTFYNYEQSQSPKHKILRKWKNTHILINSLNKPIKVEMENRLNTPSYNKPISDRTGVIKTKTKQVNQKMPMKLCTY